MLPYIIYSFGISLCNFLIIMVISRIPRTITVQVISIFKCDTTPDTKQIISSKIFCDDFEHFIWRYFHFFLFFCINNFYRVFDIKMVFFKWYRLKVRKSQKHFFFKLHCPKTDRNVVTDFYPSTWINFFQWCFDLEALISAIILV